MSAALLSLSSRAGSSTPPPSGWTSAMQEYVNRTFGVMFCFNMPVFANVQNATGNENPDLFNPTDLDFDQWLDVAESAGARYVVPVIKHHCGFCWWPSASQPHNVSASSWYAANGSPNLVTVFAEKAVARGFTLVPYFSIWDKRWETDHPGFTSGQYTQFVKDQLSEIAALCPTATAIWTDGWAWSKGYVTVNWADVRAHIDTLFPGGIILSENNHEYDLSNTDIAIWEEGVDPAVPTANTLPAEYVATIYQSAAWFATTTAAVSKTAAQIRTAINTNRAKKAAYLLSVGADVTGQIPAAAVTVMASVGPSA